jgi:hypothetical protein
MQIHACGDYYQPVTGEPAELKSALREVVTQPVRRIGRFIQLALVGAGRCVRGRAVPADTAVYLASARGDLGTTVEVLEQLFRDGQAPRPLSFINAVSNAACFYIAQCFGLQGRGSFVCNRYLAFENVLQLALLDLTLGKVPAALVGVVDMVVPPAAEHRRRLEVAAGTPLGEGSHWLWLGPAAVPDKPDLGSVLKVHHCSDQPSLLDWIRRQALPAGGCSISGGQFLADGELSAIQRDCGIGQRFEYRAGRAYYDSQSGAAVGEFVRSADPGRLLLHINSDPSGRYCAVLMRR